MLLCSFIEIRFLYCCVEVRCCGVNFKRRPKCRTRKLATSSVKLVTNQVPQVASMSFSSFFSSFLTVVHADAEEKVEVAESAQAEIVEQAEEAEEPEDVSPTHTTCCTSSLIHLLQLNPEIREECKNSTKCASLTRHFEHCQEKVLAGQGYKGEDCVEELYVTYISISSVVN